MTFSTRVCTTCETPHLSIKKSFLQITQCAFDESPETEVSHNLMTSHFCRCLVLPISIFTTFLLVDLTDGVKMKTVHHNSRETTNKQSISCKYGSMFLIAIFG